MQLIRVKNTAQKLSAFSYLLLIILLLSGCGKDKDKKEDEDAKGSSTPDTATETSSDENDDDDGPQGYFFSIEPGNSFVKSAAGRQLAQSFTVDEEIEVTKIALYLKTDTGVEDAMYIYLGVGEEDDGSEDMPWAASIKSESGGKVSKEGWYEFDLTVIGNRIFYPNTYYDIQVGFNTYPNDEKVFAWAKSKSSYANGNAWTEDPAPACGAWTTQSSYDFAMRLFSD